MAVNEYGEDSFAARRSVTPKSAATIRPMASLGSVDLEIKELSDLLDERVLDHHTANKATTSAVGAWLAHRDIVVRIVMKSDGRTGEDARDAIARTTEVKGGGGKMGHDLWLAWRDAEGHEKSLKVEITALGQRLSALQTVSRNLQKVTGL